MDLNLFIDKREIKVLLPNLVAPKTIDKFCEYLREIKTIIFKFDKKIEKWESFHALCDWEK